MAKLAADAAQATAEATGAAAAAEKEYVIVTNMAGVGLPGTHPSRALRISHAHASLIRQRVHTLHARHALLQLLEHSQFD